MLPFIHLYEDRACVCDGIEMKIVPLTSEQIVRLAAESTKLVADFLEKRHVHSGACADRRDIPRP